MEAKILYTNWKDQTEIRRIEPINIFFSSNEWHKEPQWLLLAKDLDKNAERTFAMAGIRFWWAPAPAEETFTEQDIPSIIERHVKEQAKLAEEIARRGIPLLPPNPIWNPQPGTTFK